MGSRGLLALVLVSACPLVVIASCGGDSPQAPTPPPTANPPPSVAAVEVLPAADTVFAAGETRQFQATAQTAQGSAVSGKTFTWSSSDEEVATVDQNGVATAHTFGSASIRASTNGVTGSSSFVVREQMPALVLTIQPGGARAGEPFDMQPVVELRDTTGNIIEADSTTEITVSLATGDGDLSGTLTRTAVGGGVTFTDLTIGGTRGERSLSFSAEGFERAVSDAFVLMPGAATSMALHAGNAQAAPADTDLPQPLAVRVTDAFQNGVRDIHVQWSVTSGEGSPASTTTATDDAGIAQVGYRLGRFAVAETIKASAADVDLPSVDFSATATPNATISGLVSPVAEFLSVGVSQTASPSQSPRNSRLLESLGSGAGTTRELSPVEERYVPGELLVTFRSAALAAPRPGSLAFRDGATARSVAQSVREQLRPHEVAGRLQTRGVSPAILAARVRVPDGENLEAVAAALRRSPAVASVERHPMAQHFGMHSRAMSAPGTNIPNDPLWPWQAWHYAMIDLPRAWNITTGSPSVVVAVLDDGIRFDHPAIAGNLTNDGYDFVANDMQIPICAGGSIGRAGDGDGYDPDPTIPWDVFIDPVFGCISGVKEAGGHGLHVAGTIGDAGHDGLGGTGVNWKVAIRPVRVLGLGGGGTHYDIAQGVLYAAGLPADNGNGGTVQAPSAAPIINMSLGGPVSSELQTNAIIAATNAGSLVIAAAGNDANSVPLYPAALSETISVSALSPTGNLASYSSFGPTVDIAAPGGEAGLGCDFGVISTMWNFVEGTPIYSCQQGTSMAAPHVAGVAALLLAQNPGLSRQALRARLLDYAVDIGPPGKDDFFGHGLLNARNSLTQSFAPASRPFVRLLDVESGALVSTVAAQPNGSFSFAELPDGSYHLFAGADEGMDGIVGVPLRLWGARGGSVTPSAVEVQGAGEYPANFSIGLPIEVEPNNSASEANHLALGGYVVGTLTSGGADMYAVRIPEAGTYTFETTPFRGACGFALEEDTILTLYSETGTLIAQNDDRNFAALDLCSEIVQNLDAGLYYLQVTGWNGEGRRYAVMAREGS